MRSRSTVDQWSIKTRSVSSENPKRSNNTAVPHSGARLKFGRILRNLLYHNKQAHLCFQLFLPKSENCLEELQLPPRPSRNHHHPNAANHIHVLPKSQKSPQSRSVKQNRSGVFRSLLYPKKKDEQDFMIWDCRHR